MMFKKWTMFFLICAAVLAVACPVLAEEPAVSDVLLVLPDHPSDKDRENSQVLAEILASLGHTSDSSGQGDAAKELDRYAHVIGFALEENAAFDTALSNYNGDLLLLGCVPQSAPAVLRESVAGQVSGSGRVGYQLDGEAFSGSAVFTSLPVLQDSPNTAGTVLIAGKEYPLAEGFDSVRYLALQSWSTPLERAVLTRELSLWFWPYNGSPHSYAQFAVIDGVYPFSDPEKLLATVDWMKERRMDFVISVMPLYENAEFPAMQQLCEVLRYAQANGGAVILHAPIVQGDLREAQLQEKLTAATKSLLENQVYPIGIEIPSAWVYQSELRSTLGRYRTVFVRDDGQKATFSQKSLNSFVKMGFQVVNPAIALTGTGEGYLDSAASAVYLDLSRPLADTQKTLEAMRYSAVPMKSLWDMAHTVYADDGIMISYDGQSLTVNGKIVPLTYTPRVVQANYEYHRDVFYRATISLQQQSSYLILFVLASLCIFLSFMVLARRQVRRRFFYALDKQGEQTG